MLIVVLTLPPTHMIISNLGSSVPIKIEIPTQLIIFLITVLPPTLGLIGTSLLTIGLKPPQA